MGAHGYSIVVTAHSWFFIGLSRQGEHLGCLDAHDDCGGNDIRLFHCRKHIILILYTYCGYSILLDDGLLSVHNVDTLLGLLHALTTQVVDGALGSLLGLQAAHGVGLVEEVCLHGVVK